MQVCSQLAVGSWQFAVGSDPLPALCYLLSAACLTGAWEPLLLMEAEVGSWRLAVAGCRLPVPCLTGAWEPLPLSQLAVGSWQYAVSGTRILGPVSCILLRTQTAPSP